MELPPMYDKSEATMVIGAYPDEASLDLISSKLDNENATKEDIGEVLNKLSVALMSLCKDELLRNKIGKTAPLFNLCRYLVSEFPEIVLDDETYYLRKTIGAVQDAIRENPKAIFIRDAFMEFDVEQHDTTFQFQVLAISNEKDFMPQDKIQIFTQDDEE